MSSPRQCYTEDVLAGILKNSSLGDLLEALQKALITKLRETEDHGKVAYVEQKKPVPSFWAEIITTQRADIAVITGAIAGVREKYKEP
jgi:hypothetical protein